MHEIIGAVQPRKGDVFVDLGSGLGKMVVAAALGWPFAECRGTELLPELHAQASDVVSDLQGRAQAGHLEDLPKLSVFEGDMLNTSLHDADIIYCFATCLSRNVVSI